VSCDASGEAALLAALQVIYPDAKVETLTR
jgi:hypothetical protein